MTNKQERLGNALIDSIMTLICVYGVSTEEAMTQITSAAVSCMWTIAEEAKIQDPKGFVKRVLQSAIETTDEVEE